MKSFAKDAICFGSNFCLFIIKLISENNDFFKTYTVAFGIEDYVCYTWSVVKEKSA